ncbi:MAG: DMT family transporter [Bacteroidota bacterium]
MASLAIFFMTVLVWGSTWIAIKYQAGPVAPEASVAYRFLGASLLLFLWCGLRGLSLRFAPRDHVFMALQGLCLFCLNYVPLYWASKWLTSGLVAVAFSSVVVFSILLGAVVHRRPIEPRVGIGALFGMAGLALVFWPELANFELGDLTLFAIGLALFAALMGAGGTLIGSRNGKAGIPVVQVSAYGMLYGGLATAAYVTLSPIAWSWDASPSYATSLAYLIVFGSVIGFWGFLTTVARLGPERASYIPVLFPLVALAISTLVEAYVWSAPAVAGVAFVLAGNALVLVKPGAAQKSSSPKASTESPPRTTAPARAAVSPSRFSA